MTKGPTGRIIESSVHVRESGFVRGSALHCMLKGEGEERRDGEGRGWRKVREEVERRREKVQF